MLRRMKVLLRRLQVEALEDSAGRIEQDDIRLSLVDSLRIERDEITGDLYCFKASPDREAGLAAMQVEVRSFV
jgi:hypothetical protein